MHVLSKLIYLYEERAFNPITRGDYSVCAPTKSFPPSAATKSPNYKTIIDEIIKMYIVEIPRVNGTSRFMPEKHTAVKAITLETIISFNPRTTNYNNSRNGTKSTPPDPSIRISF